MEEGVLSWFHVNPPNLNPRYFHFWSVFHTRPFIPCDPLWWHWYQKMWNFLSHLLIHAKSLSNDVHPLKRPRKCLKSIFDNYFPENLLKFGIILNDFPSLTISEFNLPIQGTDFKQTCVNLLLEFETFGWLSILCDSESDRTCQICDLLWL